MEVEDRLLALSEALDDAQESLSAAEARYVTAKSAFELAMARARVEATAHRSWTVQEREDRALLACVDERADLDAADIMVRGHKGNVFRLRTQVDIARSLAASVRSSIEM